MPSPSLVWFRDDLRVADNPALSAAALTGAPIVALHVLDAVSERIRPLGGAARWWLHHSLSALAQDLGKSGIPLLLLVGAAAEIVPDVAARLGASGVFWNRRYGAAEIAIDTATKDALRRAGVTAASYNASLLYEPWEVRSKVGEPFKVFTPFWRAALGGGLPQAPLPRPAELKGLPIENTGRLGSLSLDELALLPSPDWAGGLRESWSPGEAGARQTLATFLDDAIKGYGEGRNRPDRPSTSRLSPHLRFGEIGPRQVWHAAEQARLDGRADGPDVGKFGSELGWREFSYHLLFHNPDLRTRNFQPRFDSFAWQRDPAAFDAWAEGRTGYPIVDAGMRQLWQTGWMHNRVRMITASFLIKHLLIDWREGEAWFWNALCDADPASNTASWQWVAGSGADAAPYFRIFNPILQGHKFDPDGDYVRRFVPELARMPTAFIHHPWDASPAILSRAGIALGQSYPAPIVDHDAARARALAAFEKLKPNPDSSRIETVT
jgi:deoxyribodipyrimidine photo-lyase